MQELFKYTHQKTQKNKIVIKNVDQGSKFVVISPKYYLDMRFLI